MAAVLSRSPLIFEGASKAMSYPASDRIPTGCEPGVPLPVPAQRTSSSLFSRPEENSPRDGFELKSSSFDEDAAPPTAGERSLQRMYRPLAGSVAGVLKEKAKEKAMDASFDEALDETVRSNNRSASFTAALAYGNRKLPAQAQAQAQSQSQLPAPYPHPSPVQSLRGGPPPRRCIFPMLRGRAPAQARAVRAPPAEGRDIKPLARGVSLPPAQIVAGGSLGDGFDVKPLARGVSLPSSSLVVAEGGGGGVGTAPSPGNRQRRGSRDGDLLDALLDAPVPGVVPLSAGGRSDGELLDALMSAPAGGRHRRGSKTTDELAEAASAVAVAGAGVVREIDWDAVLSRLRSHPEEARRTSRYGWQGSRRRNPLQLAVTSRRGGGAREKNAIVSDDDDDDAAAAATPVRLPPQPPRDEALSPRVIDIPGRWGVPSEYE
mmetsp:Transcript_7819/g.23032  ORF Transcript_7819/g.23032 Transcript_7819/m.23032 type:complete len:433 (-) Transcript_7819:128-1426(-)